MSTAVWTDKRIKEIAENVPAEHALHLMRDGMLAHINDLVTENARLRALLPDAEMRKYLQEAIAIAEIDLPTYDRTKEAERANNAVHKSQAWLDILESEAPDAG